MDGQRDTGTTQMTVDGKSMLNKRKKTVYINYAERTTVYMQRLPFQWTLRQIVQFRGISPLNVHNCDNFFKEIFLIHIIHIIYMNICSKKLSH